VAGSNAAQAAAAPRPPFLARAGFRFDPPSLRGDFAGASIAAVISIAESIPYGLMVFGALGATAMAYGPIAGLYASIFGALVAAILGGTPLLISGPRASTSVVMAAMVASVAAAPGLDDHGGVPMAMALVFLGVACAGAIELLFGVFKLRRSIKFVPYPVIAGFMNGVAVLLLISQSKNLLGLPDRFQWSEWRTIPDLLHPWTAIVAAVTIGGIVAGPYISRLVPSLVTGMALSIATYYGLAVTQGLEVMGPVIGELPPAIFAPTALMPVLTDLADPWVWQQVLAMAPTIAVLAMVMAIDSLMGAAALDTMTSSRHNSNRELIGQGVGNFASAVMGGLAGSGAVARSAAGFKAGARSRTTGVMHALIVLVALLAAGPYVGTIPRVVLAAILVVVACGMIDQWSRELVSRLTSADSYRREIVANLAVVLIVAAVTVAADLITAVATGVVVSMVLFVSKMSKPIVARVVDGTGRRSLKVRDRDHAELLSTYGKDIAIVELDGPLFFGTADALVTECERLALGSRTLILDFRRVSEMDATGVRLLLLLARTVRARGATLLLGHVTRADDNGRFIAAIGGEHLFRIVGTFADVDAALEWAEDRLVEIYGSAADDGRELGLAELCLADGLRPDDASVMGQYLIRRAFKHGETLFRRGERGQSLFLLARGTVTISVARPGGGAIRFATLIPGVMFGEMALLEKQPRSADAVATTDIVVYELDSAGVDRIVAQHPELATRLMANMAREIAARLRVTSEQLRSVS
jgi:SulP family sulfate permease